MTELPRPERRLRDALHTEVMLLADEAKAVFEHGPDPGLPAGLQVEVACEGLRVTTRLLSVLAWLLEERAVDAGELPAAAPVAADVCAEIPATLPPAVRQLTETSVALVARARHLSSPPPVAGPGPARALLDVLECGFAARA